jgi:hypothetical protein
VILNLISGPRNLSTALMYSFAQRTDTTVLDEPYYAVYLAETGVPHPGASDILNALPQQEKEATDFILSSCIKPVLFLKNMAHHLETLSDPLIPGAVNIFLIRDPAQILASYAEVISQPVMRDIGIAFQYSLFRRLQEEGRQPLVVDSGLLVQDPVPVLTRLCNACGLDFEQRMAHWPAGPKPYDGVWAPIWYGNVHRSTCFEKQPTSSRPLPRGLEKLCSEASSIYQKLLPFALKA